MTVSSYWVVVEDLHTKEASTLYFLNVIRSRSKENGVNSNQRTDAVHAAPKLPKIHPANTGDNILESIRVRTITQGRTFLSEELNEYISRGSKNQRAFVNQRGYSNK